MGGESFAFSWVEYDDEVVAGVVEDGGPLFFDGCVEPHELVLGAAFDFAVVLGVEGFELVLEGFGGGLCGDEDDAEGAFGVEADVFGAFVVEFGD